MNTRSRDHRWLATLISTLTLALCSAPSQAMPDKRAAQSGVQKQRSAQTATTSASLYAWPSGRPVFQDSNGQLVYRDGYPGSRPHAIAGVESIGPRPTRLTTTRQSAPRATTLRHNGRPLFWDSNGQLVYRDGYPGSRPHAMAGQGF